MAEQNDQLDLTASGVEFAPWPTVVENDDLHLTSLCYRGSSWISYPNKGFKLALPGSVDAAPMKLEATFFSREKRGAVQFRFEAAYAFRVLDECGLLELWHASAKTPRPASSTFRVRGHAWQAESHLLWWDKDHFSYMIATEDRCLEVVTSLEPSLEIIPAVVTELPPREA